MWKGAAYQRALQGLQRANRWTAQKSGVMTKCRNNVWKCPKIVWKLPNGPALTYFWPFFGHCLISGKISSKRPFLAGDKGTVYKKTWLVPPWYCSLVQCLPVTLQAALCTLSERIQLDFGAYCGFGAGSSFDLQPSKLQKQAEDPAKAPFDFLREALVCTLVQIKAESLLKINAH